MTQSDRMDEIPLLDDDHLREILAEAVPRFAVEDHCSVSIWVARAVRFVAVQRLCGEASTDGYDWLSAQRRSRVTQPITP